MRKKRKFLANLDQLIDHKNIFRDPEQLKKTSGNWHKIFGNKNPIILEIGMGTGSFLNQIIPFEFSKGEVNNYVGLEVKGVRVFKSYRKNKELVESGKLKLIEGRAEFIDEYFGLGEVSRIHLNFSDPWPKKKHLFNRLTAPSFLELYKKILTSEGVLVMKTDNEELYRYSLETLPASGFTIIEQSEDLHHSPYEIKNFITEFETRFISKGMPIFYLKAKKV